MIDTWETWVASIEDDPRHEWCAELTARLTRRARARARLRRWDARDAGARCELRADRRRPLRAPARAGAAARAGGDFRRADFTAVDFEPGSFDAVVSFYAFNHVPRELLAPLLVRIAAWLERAGGSWPLRHDRPGGLDRRLPRSADVLLELRAGAQLRARSQRRARDRARRGRHDLRAGRPVEFHGCSRGDDLRLLPRATTASCCARRRPAATASPASTARPSRAT